MAALTSELKIRLSDELHDELERLARELATSKAALARLGIRRYVDELRQHGLQEYGRG